MIESEFRARFVACMVKPCVEEAEDSFEAGKEFYNFDLDDPEACARAEMGYENFDFFFPILRAAKRGRER